MDNIDRELIKEMRPSRFDFFIVVPITAGLFVGVFVLVFAFLALFDYVF